MWWSDRKVGRDIAVLAMLAALAGCGFRPLYGKYSGDPDSSDELASVAVASISDRNGQLVHNALLATLNPKGEPSRPRFRLVVSVGTTEAQEAIQQDETATRDQVTYTVTYILFEVASNLPLAQGSFSRVLSYDYLDQHYSNVVAAEDTQKKSADAIAKQIVDNLAAYFTRAARARAAKAAGG
jgi:LPS-assembly lipoprotein